MTGGANSGMPGNANGGRLKIAVFNRTFSATGGGAERYSIALVEQLAARHDIHVFAQEIKHQWPGVTYHRVSMPMRKPRWVNQLWFATATWWATRRGFDLVHSHENSWHGDIQTVHVLPVKHSLFQGRRGLARVLRWLKVVTSPRLLAYLALEHARYVPKPGRHAVVTSSSMLPVMAACYPGSTAGIGVITPGISLPGQPVLEDSRQTARSELNLPAHVPLILFVGNDYRKKGLQALLEALAHLSPDAALVVVGNPAHIPAFQEKVHDLKLEGRVFFLGSLMDVGPAYRAADLLVHPTWEDTFAMVVLEAMAHGLPVVVSSPAYCGISGLLSNNVNALLLNDPKDSREISVAISRILGDARVREKLSSESADFAVRYQWPQIAQQQEMLYFQSIDEKNSVAVRRP